MQQTPLEGSFLPRFPEKKLKPKASEPLPVEGEIKQLCFCAGAHDIPLLPQLDGHARSAQRPRDALAGALRVPGAVGNVSLLTNTLSRVMFDRCVKNKALFRHFRCLNIVFREGK